MVKSGDIKITFNPSYRDCKVEIDGVEVKHVVKAEVISGVGSTTVIKLHTFMLGEEQVIEGYFLKKEDAERCRKFWSENDEIYVKAKHIGNGIYERIED